MGSYDQYGDRSDHGPVVEDTFDRLRWQGTVILLGSAFSAAAFFEPALFAMTLTPTKFTARVGARRVGMADVEILAETIAHFRQLGHRHGSGRVRDQVVQRRIFGTRPKSEHGVAFPLR